jgi:hypothetical protein
MMDYTPPVILGLMINGPPGYKRQGEQCGRKWSDHDGSPVCMGKGI